MHALEVIIARNDRAAGREAAHADNDWNDREASAILSTEIAESKDGNPSMDYLTGYLAGKAEG
jgi:hypothetical protein